LHLQRGEKKTHSSMEFFFSIQKWRNKNQHRNLQTTFPRIISLYKCRQLTLVIALVVCQITNKAISTFQNLNSYIPYNNFIVQMPPPQWVIAYLNARCSVPASSTPPPTSSSSITSKPWSGWLQP
jgi:hypothetical protein